MTARLPRSSRWTRAAVAALALGALAAHLVTGSALGGVQARIDNSTNSAGSATLVYTHSYGSDACTSAPANTINDSQAVACTTSVYPATVPASGLAAQTDSISATGTTASNRVTQKAQIVSCGAVALANDKNNGNPMVARYGTRFGGAGPFTGSKAVVFDGASPGGYATGVSAQTQPTGPALLGSASYGLGAWFKATSGTAGPLFGFAATSGNAAGTNNDHILFLNSAGQIGFQARPGGSALVSTTGGFSDGGWHFAYVRIDTTRVVVGLSYTVTVYIDGISVASGSSGLLGSLASFSGYWHLGWSVVSGIPNYFTGSLSNFVVLNDGNAPTVLTGSTSQSAFDTATSSATERWRLADDGTAVSSAYTSTLPVTNAPCSYVDIKWGFTNPTSCAVTPPSSTAACTGALQLSAAVTAGAQTVASAVPNTTPLVAQISTITLSRDSTYTAGTVATFLAGLMIYAPVKLTMTSAPWTTSFMWADSPGSTFLL